LNLELKMPNPKGLPSNEMIADVIARKVFAKRGNRSEVHLSEVELAAWIKAALDTRDNLAKSLESVA
jgi:hypothetical protein